MIEVVIPIYNIKHRGFDNIYYTIYSLFLCEKYIKKVHLIDGSDKTEFTSLASILSVFYGFLNHVRYPTEEYCQPKLFNVGIDLVETEYMMTTGADFLFKPDFFEVCKKYRSGDTLLLKEVKMLPKTLMSRTKVALWRLPQANSNRYGRRANGACQYMLTDKFKQIRYDERMKGYGSMDNMLYYEAIAKGINPYWIKESEIMHQWHPVIRTDKDAEQSKANAAIAEAFINEHKIESL